MIHQGSKISVRVLSTQAPCLQPSLILELDHFRILINASEGLQRLCIQHKISINSLNNIFLTSLAWTHVGGIAGMLLTRAATSHENINVYSDPINPTYIEKINEITNHSLNYCCFHRMEKGLNFKEFENIHPCIKVKYYCQNNENIQIVILVFQFSKISGKLDTQKAIEFGLEKKHFSSLKQGLSIDLDNNRKIYPSDVMKIYDGPTVAFVDCTQCVHSYDIEKYLYFLKITSNLSIFHISKSTITHHPLYAPLLSMFPNASNYIINATSININPFYLFPSFSSVYNKYSQCSPTIFPLFLSHHQFLNPFDPTYPKNLSVIDLKNKKIEAHFECSTINNQGCTPNMENEYPCIVFLGTASSSPSKYRNVTSILASFSVDNSILFDCGEATISQLYHRFLSNISSILSSIKLIFISHIHADHHLGLISLIKSINEFHKVTLIAPIEIYSFLSFYDTYISKLCIEFIDAKLITPNYSSSSFDGEVTVIPVNHSIEAYGIRIECGAYSVVYSGDTRPCLNLCTLGKSTDILIHEATFDDDNEEEAIKRKHSTVSEAIGIGKQMEAKIIILNHFSLRYPKLSSLKKISDDAENIIYSYDFMKITPSNFFEYKKID